MEDTGVADWTNPRVREMQHFKNLFETEKRDSRMNKTSPTVAANPERSAYLFWINDGIAATREDQVGPAIALQVDKGDSLSLETWAKFERKVNYTRNATTGMLADLLGSVFVNAAYGLETATQAKQIFNTNLSAALGGTGADPATRPYAYLNYLIFDDNYVVKDGGAWRVPDNAGFDPGMETLPHQQVKFPSSIKPQQKGYIYIWVSNESENTKVWFDDLKVTHTKSRVVQASDYYAWGSTMREQRTPENPTYKYGYQGEFAEKDLETGWNHFELREYDGVVGRWTSMDPEKQFFSPYIGMANNPINGLDSKGSWVIFFFGESGVKFGIGPLASAGIWFQNGQAQDKFGVTNYTLSGSFANHNFSDSGGDASNWVLGFDLSLLEVGAGFDWKSNSFSESVSKWNLSVYTGGPVDISFGDGYFGVDGGLSFGAAISSVNPTEIRSLSYTLSEIGDSGYSGFSDWSVRREKNVFFLNLTFKQDRDMTYEVKTDIEVKFVNEGQYETTGYQNNKKN